LTSGRGKNRRRADLSEQREIVSRGVRALGKRLLRVGAAIAGVAACALGAGALHDWALASPSFALETLTFRGLHRAAESELSRMSGLAQGQNLWSLDTDSVAKEMAGHPWVRRVDVTRRFPNTVVVTVEEHEPRAMLALNELYLIDAQGEPFKKVDAEDGLDLPLVTGVTRQGYDADNGRTVALLARALEVAEAYEGSPAGRGERLSEVRWEDEGFTLVTGKGERVRLGEGAVDEKLSRLGRVREELSKRNLSASAIRLDNRTRPGWVSVELDKP
jgi:cell division protein FtsQ